MLSRLVCGNRHGPYLLHSMWGACQGARQPRTPSTLPWRGLRQPRGSSREGGMNLAPKVVIEAPHGNNMGAGLVKSCIFTLGFCGMTFVGATLWQYENVRHQLQQHSWTQWATKHWNHMEGWEAKEGNIRKELNRWWNGLNEGQKVFWPICLINAIVFGCWNNPRYQQTMLRYFCSNPAARAVCWPMVLSTFSHFAFFHFAMNMYVLHSFSSTVCRDMGREQFLTLYLCGGVLSSLASHAFKVAMRCPGPSLGASGAIMAVLGFFCTRHPEAQLGIVFIPGLSFSADTALKCVMSLDAAGMVIGWRVFDHAAHLGGALFGLLYATFGQKYVWANNEPLMKKWHQFRTWLDDTSQGKGKNDD